MRTEERSGGDTNRVRLQQHLAQKLLAVELPKATHCALPLRTSSRLASPPVAMSSSSAAPSELLSALQLDKHPAVAGAIQAAAAVAAQRRYRQAEQQLRAFLQDTQQEIQQAKLQAANPSENAPAPLDLPTLSQLLTGVLPYLRTLAALQKEAESGEYDLRIMQQEVEQYKRAAAAHAAASNTDSAAVSSVPVTRPPHADYVHPRVHVVPIAGRSRGLIASTTSVPAGCVAAAASAGARPVVIPANTLVLASKAVALVTDEGSAQADGASAAPSVTREERTASALVTLLALKMQAQPSLISQLYQLDAGERYEEDRARRLAERSPLDVYRAASADASGASQAADEVEAVTDLEIDLERLALIVARNAFAPPSESALQEQAASAAAAAAPSSAPHSSGVWLTSSFLNHSCHPNAHWFCVGDHMFVRTLRDLHEGDEVSISYTGFDAKSYAARQSLCAGWGFTCHCKGWCEAYEAHTQLRGLEESFLADTGAMEPRVHELVATLQQSDEGTLTYKRAVTELTTLKSTLANAIDNFKTKVGQLCGPQCKGKGEGDNNEAETATEEEATTTEAVAATASPAAAATPAAAGGDAAVTAAKKKKKKKKGGAAAAAASSGPDLLTFPAHTRPVLVHLAEPLSLLALCHSSMHAPDATMAQYKESLQRHEKLMTDSASLLARQYGSGDETVIFTWLQLLNTWVQFLQAGVEYRSVDEIRAVLADMCVKAHCTHFGTKPDHFRHMWGVVINNMGLTDMLEA